MFEGETVALVKQACEQAVDDYLADCAQLGYTPEVPCKGVFNVSVGHALHLKAAMTARNMGVSLNDLVCRSIEQMTASKTAVWLAMEACFSSKLLHASLGMAAKKPLECFF